MHVDIDECKDGGNLCQNGTCTNNDGSFDCFCPPGYIFDSSGKYCIGQLTFTKQLCVLSDLHEFSVDLNECTLGVHDCDDNAVCSNYGGGYDCSCKRDHFGDGKSCFR